MGFEAQGKTVMSLINSHRTFSIPRFQRDFSWDKHNYDEFYRDILNQLSFTNNEIEVEKYFLGNMIFLGSKDEKIVEVIDGQQRLTTITIVLAAIRNKLLSIDSKEAKDIANTTQNEYIIKSIDGQTYRRLEPKTSFPYFANTIQDTEKNNQKPTTEEERDLKIAFDNFCNKLSFEQLKKDLRTNKNKDIVDGDYTRVLKAIRDQILGCEIVAIYVDDKIQANKIFENINSKGKPLSQVDLVKNYIFNHITPSNVNVDNIQLKWVEMKNKLIDKETESNNYSINFDMFFIDYIKAKYPTLNVNNKNLYEKFRREFKTTDKIKFFCDEMYVNIDLYINVINPNFNNYKRQEKQPIFYALQAINRFKGKQVRIPLLSLFIKDKAGKHVKSSDMVDFVVFLSIFHFAVFGLNVKFRSNQLTAPFKTFSDDISKSTSKSEVKNAINKLKKTMLSKISKELFIENFIKLTFNKHKAKIKEEFTEFPTTFALNTIENKLSSIKVNHNDSSIEHIYDEEHGEIRIGNLLTLETSLNKRLSELKQEKKMALTIDEKKDLYSQSKYKIVNDFLSNYQRFELEDVPNRSRKLAEFFYTNFLKNEES